MVHADISERAAYPGQEFTRAKWFLERHSEYQIVLCGDVHMEFMAKDKGRFLADTGPMVRKEATEYNMTHLPNFLVYDTETDKVSKVFIPCKPASEVLDRDRLLKAGMVSTMLDDFIGELQNGGTEGEEVSFDEFLMTFIRDNKIPASVVRLISERMEVRQNGN